MSLEDRHVTPTPEGISLDLVLAGLGSRFAAYALDALIQVVTFTLVAIIVVNTTNGGQTGSLVRAGSLSAAVLVVFFGYFVLLDMLWSGRSVGKRAAGIRVVRPDATSIGFWSSLLRNIARLVDMLPFPFYVVGSILILATPKNQRLGDFLGGTLVIRERQAATALRSGTPFTDPSNWVLPAGGPGLAWGTPAAGGMLPTELAHWDVSAVPDTELTLVRRFLANRHGYTPDARHRLAMQLAARVWPLVSGPVDPPPPEAFLEAVLLVKSARG